jgi:nanoRNase/pAp phosphatase (c-di-AMP/oligoRNAs hydrolase)
MPFFRTLTERLESLTRMITPRERWLILISADPDALGSAMALRQIIRSRGGQAEIGHVNDISRPDNLAMIHTLRIPLTRVTPQITSCCQRFAMVDSQPHHSTDFPPVDYDVILDHHPIDPTRPPVAKYLDVPTGYGACSSLLTEYLYNLGIKPGKLLATALLYGIKTDTGSFERDFSDVDVKAFSYLSKLSDKLLLRRIVHADFHRHWLKYFSRAFERLRFVGRDGLFAYVGPVENPDVLVVLADFFLRVHGLSWVCIAGVSGERLIAVMRSDGLRRDIGQKARTWFGGFGCAGGRKMAARAEIELSRLAGYDPEQFLWKRLTGQKLPSIWSEAPEGEACPVKTADMAPKDIEGANCPLKTSSRKPRKAS